MSYVKVEINLSPKQKQSIARAASSKSSIRLKFTNTQLQQNTNSQLLLTRKQVTRINNAISAGRGTMITLSNKQLNSIKSGGFLAPIIASLVGSLAPVLFNRIFPENQDGNGIDENYSRCRRIHPDMIANGINLPGAGINLPGMSRGEGVILPANGENTQYHISGNHISYLPNNNGSGLVLPGTTQRRQKALGLPRKKNKMLAMEGEEYTPNSQSYQYLQ